MSTNKNIAAPDGVQISPQMITPFHAKYFAHEITARKAGNMVDRLSHSLVESAVDMNPHQIEAALFALRSPLSKGVILADEVGLGKTIEAGLLLCQFWSEHKRRLLIVCPASLRRQWSIELEEKFHIPSLILDSRALKEREKENKRPLHFEGAVIMSFQFAGKMKDTLKRMDWDLCVFDEAHKLRNLYKKDNKIGRALYEALGEKKKILLTATPLQNTLMELYGLSMLVDDRIFGSEEAFRENYVGGKPNLAELKERLKPFVHRTLRRDVLEYIKYTNREAITVPFTPSAEEEALYHLISDFILRMDTYSIPVAQRNLVVLVIRKLLASSTYAIIGTLKTIRQRLLDLQAGLEVTENVAAQLSHENDLGSEYDEDAEGAGDKKDKINVDPARLKAEISEIEHFISLARAITTETKAVKLLQALQSGFERMRALGAQEKVIVFTESNRTQRYLMEYLERQPEYKGQVVTFNGQNSDERSREVYRQWLEEHAGTDRITGSKDVDMRQALVDHFKNHAKVMIATEAAAEGMNLQFCSLLVNYDLPWNPQRVEQRIGRCHRYGQKFDVVVINFLNEKNWADQRIYELLRDKFKLFDGVFGASDEILGRIEDGLDFEKRISAIFDTCRTQDEIQEAFTQLQQDLEQPISDRISQAREMLFEHFDEDVHQRLRMHKDQALARRDEVLEMFWLTTKYILSHHNDNNPNGAYYFDDKRRMFGILREEIEQGRLPDHAAASFAYKLVGPESEEAASLPPLTAKEKRLLKLKPRIYKPSTPLGTQVIETARTLDIQPAHLVFDYSNYPRKISVLENLAGKSGWMIAMELTTRSFEESTHLIFVVCDEMGAPLPEEVGTKLMRLDARVEGAMRENPAVLAGLQKAADKACKLCLHDMEERNGIFFNEEMDKLDKWADDRRTGLKASLKQLDDEIKEIKKQVRNTGTLPEKLTLQKKTRKLEEKRDQAWRDYDAAARDIEAKKDDLIDRIEAQLKQKTSKNQIFMISYAVQ